MRTQVTVRVRPYDGSPPISNIFDIDWSAEQVDGKPADFRNQDVSAAMHREIRAQILAHTRRQYPADDFDVDVVLDA